MISRAGFDDTRFPVHKMETLYANETLFSSTKNAYSRSSFFSMTLNDNKKSRIANPKLWEHRGPTFKSKASKFGKNRHKTHKNRDSKTNSIEMPKNKKNPLN